MPMSKSKTCGQCASWEQGDAEQGWGPCKATLPVWALPDTEEVPQSISADDPSASYCDAFQPSCKGSDDPEAHLWKIQADGDTCIGQVCVNCRAQLTEKQEKPQ